MCVKPHVAGTRDTEKYPYLDWTKVKVTVKGSPNKIYSNGIEAKDFWEEARRYINPIGRSVGGGTPNINHKKFYTEDKFGLLIDMRSMTDQAMHGSGMQVLNVEDGIQLELERDLVGSGNVNCHVFVISDSQLNIRGRQFYFVQYNSPR